MNSIKRFLFEEKGSSEAVSSVILIAGAGILLLAGIALYYGAFKTFFTTAASRIVAMSFCEPRSW